MKENEIKTEFVCGNCLAIIINQKKKKKKKEEEEEEKAIIINVFLWLIW